MKKWNKQTWAFIIAGFLLIPFILSGEDFDTSKAQVYKTVKSGYFGTNKTSFESNIIANIVSREASAHTVLKAALDIKDTNPQLNFIRVRLYKNSISYENQRSFVTWADDDNYEPQGWVVTTQDSKKRQSEYKLK